MRAANIRVSSFTRKSLIVAGISIAAFFLVLLLYKAGAWFFVIFAAVLVGVVVRGAGLWIASKTGLSPGWSTAVVILTSIAAIVGLAYAYGPDLYAEMSSLSGAISSAIQGFDQHLQQTRLGRVVSSIIPGGQRIEAYFRSRLDSVIAASMNVLTGVLVIVAAAIYLAARPEIYLEGLLKLVPPRRRDAAKQLLRRSAQMLRWWMMGQAISMMTVGVLTAVGLWIIGLKMAFGLGILAGLLEFIPTVGPFLSFVPAFVIALGEAPDKMWWVLGLYLAVQGIESYLLTPLVQYAAVYLPPALTLSVQLIIGMLFGFMGLLLAVPITVVGYTFVNTLYVERFLGESPPEELRDVA